MMQSSPGDLDLKVTIEEHVQEAEVIRYKIRCECPSTGQLWFVFKRYREFEELHEKIKGILPADQIPHLTSKKLFNKSHDVIEKRIRKLTTYLRYMIEEQKPKEGAALYLALVAFLAVPPKTKRSKTVFGKADGLKKKREEVSDQIKELMDELVKVDGEIGKAVPNYIPPNRVLLVKPPAPKKAEERRRFGGDEEDIAEGMSNTTISYQRLDDASRPVDIPSFTMIDPQSFVGPQSVNDSPRLPKTPANSVAGSYAMEGQLHLARQPLLASKLEAISMPSDTESDEDEPRSRGNSMSTPRKESGSQRRSTPEFDSSLVLSRLEKMWQAQRKFGVPQDPSALMRFDLIADRVILSSGNGLQILRDSVTLPFCERGTPSVFSDLFLLTPDGAVPPSYAETVATRFGHMPVDGPAQLKPFAFSALAEAPDVDLVELAAMPAYAEIMPFFFHKSALSYSLLSVDFVVTIDNPWGQVEPSSELHSLVSTLGAHHAHSPTTVEFLTQAAQPDEARSDKKLVSACVVVVQEMQDLLARLLRLIGKRAVVHTTASVLITNQGSSPLAVSLARGTLFAGEIRLQGFGSEPQKYSVVTSDEPQFTLQYSGLTGASFPVLVE